jgi:Holliday junction resolvase RusA-like endonuclease
VSAVLAFIIEGTPPSGNRASRVSVTGAHYTPAATREYRERIASVAFAEIRRQKFERADWYALEITAYNVRPDTDNIASEPLDGLQGVVYDHDSQVLDLHVLKRKDKAGTRLAIRVTHVDGAATGYGKRR